MGAVPGVVGSLPVPRRVEESFSVMPQMTGSHPSRRSILAAAGAVFPLLVWALLAPAEARAGCSHLVVSRTDRALREALASGNSNAEVGSARRDRPSTAIRSTIFIVACGMRIDSSSSCGSKAIGPEKSPPNWGSPQTSCACASAAYAIGCGGRSPRAYASQ